MTMLAKVFYQKKEKLDRLMEQDNYLEADVICQELRQELGSIDELSVEQRYIVQDLAQMNAVMVIETNTQNRMDDALQFLLEAGEHPYSVFLRARLFWAQKKYYVALTMLEEYFMVANNGNQLTINAQSPYYAISPDTKERLLNLLGQAYKFYGMCEVACACYLEASRVVEYFPAKVLEYSNYLFDSHYCFMSKDEYLRIHLGFNVLFKDFKGFKHKKYIHARHEKIRIGYLSPDFRHHVVLLFMWAMLTKYSRDRFEVYCFSNSPVEDKYSEHIKQQVDFWCNISSLNYQQAAQFIYKQEIDILVELAGHSQNNGLPILAYKPAPVQVCGIGYFATTGLRAVDYFLTDKYLVNETSQNFFVEELLVLPHSHFCYVPLNEVPEVQGAPCKKNGYVTFGSLNNLTKVNDTVLQVWALLLKQVPNSKLLLKSAQLDDEAGYHICRQKLLDLGIEENRFELRGFSFPYLTTYYEIDIALDTFPYPGGGTTCDALYMGVPVITVGDDSHGGNFSVSLLKNVGLEECCANSLDEYVEKAVMFASDYDLLEYLHLGLRKMMQQSPVMQQEEYMHDLETAYEKIWANYKG